VPISLRFEKICLERSILQNRIGDAWREGQFGWCFVSGILNSCGKKRILKKSVTEYGSVRSDLLVNNI
jgi:hypothetical protein